MTWPPHYRGRRHCYCRHTFRCLTTQQEFTTTSRSAHTGRTPTITYQNPPNLPAALRMGWRGRPCYWGCGTPTNKVIWAMAILGLITGSALIIAGAVSGHDCLGKYAGCVRDGRSPSRCSRIYDDVCNVRRYQALIAAGVLIGFFLVPFLTIWFCCFSRDPRRPMGGEVTMVVVSEAPPAPPYGAPPPYYQTGAYPPAPAWGPPPGGPQYAGYPPPYQPSQVVQGTPVAAGTSYGGGAQKPQV